MYSVFQGVNRLDLKMLQTLREAGAPKKALPASGAGDGDPLTPCLLAARYGSVRRSLVDEPNPILANQSVAEREERNGCRTGIGSKSSTVKCHFVSEFPGVDFDRIWDRH